MPEKVLKHELDECFLRRKIYYMVTHLFAVALQVLSFCESWTCQKIPPL